MNLENRLVYSIGHSNLSYRAFAALLRKTGIEQVVDVRSRPYSKYVKHFNYELLKQKLKQSGFDYLYLGNQLGSDNVRIRALRDSHAEYRARLAQTSFEDGMQQLRASIERRRVAVMCVEADPYRCHRHTVIAAELEKRGIAMDHILKTGLTSHAYGDSLQAFSDSSQWIQRTLFEAQPAAVQNDVATNDDPFRRVA